MDSKFYSFTILERKLFVPLSEEIGLSVDKVRKYCSYTILTSPPSQIRYIVLFFVSIFLGLFMKYVLHPSRVSNTTRHCYSFVVGLIFGLVCFGPMQVEFLLINASRECDLAGGCHTCLQWLEFATLFCYLYHQK